MFLQYIGTTYKSTYHYNSEYQHLRELICTTDHRSVISELTLLDIMIVNNALLFELMATFRVVAWNSTNTLCKTEVNVKAQYSII